MWGTAATDLLQGSGFLEYLKELGKIENKNRIVSSYTKDRRVLCQHMWNWIR